MIARALPAVAAAGLALAGPSLAMVQTSPPAGDHVTATIVPGQAPYPTTAQAQAAIHPGPRPGDVSLNFPAADVHDVAKAVLGDLLHVRYTVDPAAAGAVTLVTAQPIARDEVLGALEDALAAAKLALVRRGGAYAVIPLAQARAEAPAPEGDAPGFASETVQLRFIAGAELKKLLDPVAPDTIAVSDPARNIVTLSGPQGRRRAARALIEQFDVDWLRGMSFGLFVPKNTDSRLLVPEIEKLLNGEGSPSAGLVRLIAMDKINGVLAVSAQPQYLEDVRRWIEVLDREGESSERRLFVYRVQYGKASDLARAINAVFGVTGGAAQAVAQAAAAAQTANGFDLQTPPPPPALATAAAQRPVQNAPGRTGEGLGGATVTSDETNNAVLVLGAPREYAVVEDALRKLDVAPVQVLIEAAIAEVTLNHNLQYGIQWNFQTGHNQFNLLPNTGTVTGPATGINPATTTVATALTQAGQSLPGFNYLYANTGTITATLNALSGLTTVNVLSAPKMMVLNNHTASLEVGDQVPVVTASAVSTVGSNAPLVNSVDYRDTGVILKVTPRVNSGGMVLLDIAQEVSDVTTTSTSNINSPTIEQRKFATSIAVQDGQTIALGGLIKDTRTKGRSGLPVLSAIPILGALAGTRTDSDVRTELLILLTPRVVRSAPDAEAITEDLRKKIQALEPLPPDQELPSVTGRADDGYAIVAAVAALAVFAALALTALQTDRGDLADLRAQMTQARLEAAASAGLAQAIEGLAVDDPAQRWSIDGRPRSLVFEGVTLTVVVEDERGKLPMADLTDEQVLRLFRAGGASADQAGALADAYQDWLDDDDNPRAKGAEAPQYLAVGIHPRNGPPVTVDELARLRGMTPAVFARVAPVLTPYFGISGNFEPRNASPLAVAVMSTGGEGGPEAIERQRETDGERAVLEIQPDVNLAGRNLTVAVLAQDGQGGSLQRRTVVEFTGRPSPAYYIRELR